MKKTYIVFIAHLLMLFSCTKNEKVLNYDEYSFDNKLKKRNATSQAYKYLKNDESELTISYKNYKKTIIVKEIGDKIYWKCNNKFILSHSLDAKDKFGSCYDMPPFLNKRVKLIGNKTYIIDGKKYTIYSYGESSGSESDVATYFLKDVGFICYYSLSSKTYYFLSGFSGINSSTFLNIELLRKELTTDTSFFVSYLVKVDQVSKL